MKLHAQNMLMFILCIFHLKWVLLLLLMNCCKIMWTVVVVVERCYYWWLEPWVIIIIEICWEIGVFLWVFTKMGQMGIFDLKDVLAQISHGFESLLGSENGWVISGNQFGIEGVQNWDFGMKNEFFVTVNCQYSPRRVSLRARRATWSQRAMFARHGEQSYSLRRAWCHRGHVLPATASRTTRHGEQRGDIEGTLPATASYSAWEASCLSSSFSVLYFGSFFTYFHFELTLGINIKVLEVFISFPMALNWFENTLWILIVMKTLQVNLGEFWRSYGRECIYVCGLSCDWWTHMLTDLWMCWWLHICHVTMNYWWIHICIYVGDDMVILFVWTYALSRVICSCIHDWWWWWRIFISKCKTGWEILHTMC